MDRNYFLSYNNRTALLALLFIMGVFSITSLSARMRVQTDDNLQLSQVVVSTGTQQFLFEINDLTNINEEIGNSSKETLHNFYTIFNGYFCHNNALHVHDHVDFFSVILQDITLMRLVGFWVNINKDEVNSNAELLINNQIFRNYFLKLVDGFKFIIKIPDKLIPTSI